MTALRPLVSPRTAALPQSPFRTKGIVFLGTRGYFESQVKGGFARLLEEVGPGPLRDFIDQKFLPGGFYEALVVPSLITAEAAAAGQSERVYMRHRAEYQARIDMGGIYKVLLAVASPELVVPRLPKVMSQVYNFGVPTITKLGPNEYSLRVDGVPAVLGPWLTNALETYVAYVLSATGAKHPDVCATRPTTLPPEQGYPLVGLELLARWD